VTAYALLRYLERVEGHDIQVWRDGGHLMGGPPPSAAAGVSVDGVRYAIEGGASSRCTASSASRALPRGGPRDPRGSG